jgi:hypothetical protein
MIHPSKRIKFYADRYQNNGKRKAKVYNFMKGKLFRRRKLEMKNIISGKRKKSPIRILKCVEMKLPDCLCGFTHRESLQPKGKHHPINICKTN